MITVDLDVASSVVDRRGTHRLRGIARSGRGWLAALVMGVTVVACGSAGGGGDVGADGEVSGELIVFAAASLTDAFGELGEAFVSRHPDIEVLFNHAGSQTLASQISEGAPADVFASANTTQMDVVVSRGELAGDATVFTGNALEIGVETGNPLGVGGLEDLASPELLLVLPSEDVPAGEYAAEALDTAGVEVTPVSLERDVRAALSKVELGEADATIVFASDLVASDGRADGVAIPADQNVLATYPIGVLADASNPAAAEAFVAFVLSDAGQAILASHGFMAP